MKTIAFVDDEQGILDGLRRTMRSYRKEWDMHFFLSGSEALKAFTLQSFDAIISDMRMPSMNGAELLSIIKEKSPETLRIALSGYANEEMTLESLHATHQFIAKPADQEVIIQSIERAFSLQSSLAPANIKALLGSIDALPVLPHIYDELMAEISSEDASIDRIGDIIASDLSLSSNLLKIVNSAFFGLARHIESPQQAASILGTDTIKNIALTTSVFSSFKTDKKNQLDCEKLNTSSQRIGLLAGKMAKATDLSIRSKDHAQIAAMMVNLGELIALTYPKQLCSSNAEANNYPLLGSYLLGIWAMPFPVIEAVRWHRQPTVSGVNTLSPLAIAHAAWSMFCTYEQQQKCPLDSELIDTSYLAAVANDSLIQQWHDITVEFCSNDGK